MSITPEKKRELIKKYAKSDNDTGSPEVQIAVLTERITNLTEHFKQFKQDHHSRRGLMRLVANRRSLLDYLKRKDVSRYQTTIKELNIRK